MVKEKPGRKQKSSASTAGKTKKIKKSKLEAKKEEIKIKRFRDYYFIYNSHDSVIFIKYILVA